MSTQRHHRSDNQTNPGVAVAFTPRGEAALEELADALAADLVATLAKDSAGVAEAPTPAIEALLSRVMSADVEDLAAAVSAADPTRSGGVDRLPASRRSSWRQHPCPGDPR